jgi:hypothetical protein
MQAFRWHGCSAEARQVFQKLDILDSLQGRDAMETLFRDFGMKLG